MYVWIWKTQKRKKNPACIEFRMDRFNAIKNRILSEKFACWSRLTIDTHKKTAQNEYELLNGIKVNYTCLHTLNNLQASRRYRIHTIMRWKLNWTELMPISLTTHHNLRVNDPLEMVLILFGAHCHQCFSCINS